MKDEISSMDLVALVQELKVLEGSRIDKFYQRDNELIMYAYKPGDKKYRLFMTAGKAFLTDYKREMPDRPPSFCMFLRKKLSGRVIERVEQYDFDRILEIHTDDDILICELFRQGNFILTNKNHDIQNAMTSGTTSGSREVYSGEQYEFPEETQDPSTLGIDFLDQFPDKDLVVVLAAEMGLGGSYAEEVCARAEIDKKTTVADLSDEEKQTVLQTFQTIYDTLENGPLDPRVYTDMDRDDDYQGPVAATPIPFATYNDKEAEAFDSFSKALDTYFTEREKAEYQRKKTKKYREQKEKLERRLDQQEHKLEGLKEAVGENKEKGDLIYENYSIVEGILDTVKAARDQYSESEIKERLESEQAQGIPEAEAIVRLDFNNQAVVVDLGEEIRIDLTKDVERNAEYYYEKSKKAKQKIEGVKKALKNTRQQLESLEKTDVNVEQAFKNKAEKKEKKEWYEKFRWFYSSDGFLVIGGRDTTTNDMLVKKYLEDPDKYVHAEFTGAPSVAIKTEGDDVPETTLEEAGQFAVTFARSWEAGVTAEDAYWVEPEQVTQEPESGEYLPKGSFVIRGDRNYMNNLEISAAVGAYERDGQLVAMGGPESAIQHHCDHYVVLKQGREKPSDVAKQVQSHLNETTGGDFDLDRIIRSLPPGNCTIAEKY